MAYWAAARFISGSIPTSSQFHSPLGSIVNVFTPVTNVVIASDTTSSVPLPLP
jgi:hypothetical protein